MSYFVISPNRSPSTSKMTWVTGVNWPVVGGVGVILEPGFLDSPNPNPNRKLLLSFSCFLNFSIHALLSYYCWCWLRLRLLILCEFHVWEKKGDRYILHRWKALDNNKLAISFGHVRLGNPLKLFALSNAASVLKYERARGWLFTFLNAMPPPPAACFFFFRFGIV